MNTYYLQVNEETLLLSVDNEIIELPLTGDGTCMDSRYRIQGFKKIPDEVIIKNYQFSKIDYDYPTTATVKHDRQGFALGETSYDATNGLLSVTFDASVEVGFIELLITGEYPNTEKIEYLQTMEIVAIGVFL